VATFVVAGALHDACMYAVAFDAAGRSMRAFSLVGAVVCSWVALAWVWRRLTTAAAIGGRLAQALGIVSRISFITLVVACVAWGWS
jgi:ABC-type Fe3+-siderophore transport system permease subunit